MQQQNGTPVGLYHDYLYYGHGGPYHYDYVKVLDLEVVAIPCGDDVYDVDHNMYPTVAVAGYCWTKKNLMVEHYPDGTTLIPGAMVYSGNIYNNIESNLATYGRLYTWYSAVNVPEDGSADPIPDDNGYIPGICPTNWHIPSDDEWTQLENYVKNQALYLCNNTANNIAKALASPNTWTNHTTNCNVGCAPSDNNETGFSAVAAGAHTAKGTNIADKDQIAYFWSTTTNASSTAIAHKISYNSATVTSTNYSRSNAYSVRCIKNVDVISPEILMKMPQVVTQAVSSVGANTATIDVIVSLNAGGTAITSRGICWSSTQTKPTIASNKSATGTYTESWMYAPNNQQYNVPRYGYLYNWYATTNGNTNGSTDGNPLQGICPEEWHIPSEAEWNTLINTVQGQTDCQCNNDVNKIAKALSSPIVMQLCGRRMLATGIGLMHFPSAA